MPASAGRTVDIVVPLARDPARVATCVTRVLESRNATPLDVIVVASGCRRSRARSSASAGAGDARVRVVDARGVARLCRRCVDRGVALHADRDVVVLRSRCRSARRLARSAGGACCRCRRRHRRHVHQRASVAVSYPRADERTNAPRDASIAESLDALFARVESRAVRRPWRPARSPCVYVTRACLVGNRRLALAVQTTPGHCAIDFSPRRARSAGFDTRIAGDVFARGDGRRPMTGRAMARSRDAAARLRFAGRVAIARLAASPRPAIVFVSHAWGGGIRRHMDDLAALVRDRADVLYLEPADATTVKLHCAARRASAFAAWFRLPDDLPVARADAARDRRRAAALPSRARLAAVDPRPARRERRSRTTARCTTTTRSARNIIWPTSDGRYCGEPDEAGCARLPWRAPGAMGSRHRARGAQALGEFAPAAPSASSRRRTTSRRASVATCPDVAIDVWPHPERRRSSRRRVVRVVTLGNLSREKGLHVVARVRARRASARAAADVPRARPTTRAAAAIARRAADDPWLVRRARAAATARRRTTPTCCSFRRRCRRRTRTRCRSRSRRRRRSSRRRSARSSSGSPVARDVRLLPWNATATQWNAALLDAAARPAQPTRAAAEDSLRRDRVVMEPDRYARAVSRAASRRPSRRASIAVEHLGAAAASFPPSARRAHTRAAVVARALRRGRAVRPRRGARRARPARRSRRSRACGARRSARARVGRSAATRRRSDRSAARSRRASRRARGRSSESAGRGAFARRASSRRRRPGA